MDKKLNTGAIVTSYIIGAIALTLGILTCVFSNNSDFQKAIIMTVGIIVVVVASIDLLGLIRDLFRPKLVDTPVIDYHRSLMSAFALAIGIIVIIVANDITADRRYADIIFDYVSLLAGISMVIVGAVNLLKGILFMVRNDDVKSKNIYRIIGGIVLLLAGILVLALIYPAPEETVFQIFFMLLGIYIIVFALAIILVTTNTIILHARLKKHAEAVEDELEEHEEEAEESKEDSHYEE